LIQFHKTHFSGGGSRFRRGGQIVLNLLIIGAPEAINLGTGKRSSYCLDVPLSGRQLTRVKVGFRHISEVRFILKRMLKV
jgi:hypothetical protein